MTIELLHPDDSGEVTRLPGEETVRIVGEIQTRMRIDTGEPTQRIDPRLIKAPSFDAIPRKTFDIDDTVVYRRDTVVYDQPPTVGIVRDLAGPQSPPPPLPKPPSKADPAETGVNIFGGLGEHLPEVPEPHEYVGRHRHPEDLDEVTDWEMHRPTHGRYLSPWWALTGVVAFGLAIWAGLYWAATVVFP